jgi:hypothetical protein
MGRSNLHLTPRSGITLGEARDARVRAWKFIFDRYREKAARTDGGEDAKKEKK